jgi:hypothetical protein
MEKKDDFYIAFLTFVKERTAETGVISWGECNDFLEENFSNLNQGYRRLFIANFTSAVAVPQGQGPQDLRKLTGEAYFHLLEHTELVEARASSRQALKRSTIAICVSLLLALTSIVKQLLVTADVNIKEPIIVKMPHAHSY